MQDKPSRRAALNLKTVAREGVHERKPDWSGVLVVFTYVAIVVGAVVWCLFSLFQGMAYVILALILMASCCAIPPPRTPLLSGLRVKPMPEVFDTTE